MFKFSQNLNFHGKQINETSEDDKCHGEKIKQGKKVDVHWVGAATLYSVVGKSLSNTMPFEQTHKGRKEGSHISFLWENLFRQKKQMVQRPWNRVPYSRKSTDTNVAKAG